MLCRRSYSSSNRRRIANHIRLDADTAAFVDEIFFVIRSKSYLPGYSIPKSETRSPPFTAPLGPSGAYGQLGGRGGFNGAGQQSRKRSYNDRQEEGNGGDAHYNHGDRQMKHPRMGGARGGRSDSFSGRGGRGGRPAHQNSGLPGIPSPAAMGFPGLLPPPPAMPFDPNDPVAAMLAMQQAMGFPPLPGMPLPPQAGSPTGFPPFPAQNSPASSVPPKQRINARCRDYDTKGFCTRGNACPFEHGTDLIVVPGQQEGTIIRTHLVNLADDSTEYDPKNSVMLDIQRSPSDTNGHTTFDSQRGNDRGRGRGRGRGDRGGPINTYTPRRNRADFSYAGPINDRFITTIVVEQIPEEKFDEQSVRDFFGDFGEIKEVTMQAYKRLALVKYTDWASAKRAYDSPKVIFDNRFVKVYWYKPDSLPTPPANGLSKPNSPTVSKPEEPTFDREKFERDALAAQKKLEEKKALLKDTEAKRQALERQKEDLARKQAEETRKLREKLAAKEAKPGDTSPRAENDVAQNGTHGDGKTSAMTEMLRAQLATLEAEAKSLGIDPATTTEDPAWVGRGRGRGRGRGSYRGWEGFAGRGGEVGGSARGGGYRGRGSAGFRGGGAYNLDNRPRKVAVTVVGTDAGWDARRDEGLRQWLLVSFFLSFLPFLSFPLPLLSPHHPSSTIHALCSQTPLLNPLPHPRKFQAKTHSLPHPGRRRIHKHRAAPGPPGRRADRLLQGSLHRGAVHVRRQGYPGCGEGRARVGEWVFG